MAFIAERDAALFRQEVVKFADYLGRVRSTATEINVGSVRADEVLDFARRLELLYSALLTSRGVLRGYSGNTTPSGSEDTQLGIVRDIIKDLQVTLAGGLVTLGITGIIDFGASFNPADPTNTAHTALNKGLPWKMVTVPNNIRTKAANLVAALDALLG